MKDLFHIGVGVLALLLIVIVIFSIIAMPVIWSLNTLFGLAIAYNAKTILAMVVLVGAFKGKTIVKTVFSKKHNQTFTVR